MAAQLIECFWYRRYASVVVCGEELDLKGKAVCYGEAGARLGSMARAWGGFRVER